MFFILALVLMVVLIGGRKLQLVPKNKFLNTVEYGYDFVNTSIGQDVIGEGFKKHIPFCARCSSSSSSLTSWV